MLNEENAVLAGKQAKVLATSQISEAIRLAGKGRNGKRNQAMVLLSVRAGLRAAEIAGLTWQMVSDAQGGIGHSIELQDYAAKRRSGRTIPMHPDVRACLVQLRRADNDEDGPIFRSQRGGAIAAHCLVNWFRALYARLGYSGCSSHSGRRTFITRAAKLIYRAGGSLRDVQQLAGHRSIDQTQAYIDGDTQAKRRLVALL
jgi:integrase